jgi:hypothetical protein
MTDLGVSLHQYVGRGKVIGRVGDVNVRTPPGTPGPAHLHYEQAYQPGVTNADFDPDGTGKLHPYLEREPFNLSVTGSQIRTSTNNCFGGGTPGSVTQYDVPRSTSLFSPSRVTLEILTRRTGDDMLFEHRFVTGLRSDLLPHAIAGQPAVAVFEGDLHVIARKSDGTLFDLQYNPVAGWKTTYLEGSVAGDPDVAVYGWSKNLHVAARGRDGFLYHWSTAANGSWSRPARVDDLAVVGTPALFSHYDTLYIVARTGDRALWSWKWDRRGQWRKSRLLGAANDNPDIGVDPRSRLVNVVARGADNGLYRWQSKDPDRTANHAEDGWNPPELVDAGRFIAGAPATTIHRGAMHIVARGSNNEIYHWWKDASWHWEAAPGAYSGNPDVVQFVGLLEAVGRGMDGKLYTVWYDPVTSRWGQKKREADIAE